MKASLSSTNAQCTRCIATVPVSSSLTLGAGVSGRSDIFAEKGHHDRSQQKIAKLFSLVCFANCAVHIATIPPLYFCHFSCYGVVALLWRVSPVKLPLLGIYRTLQNARAEKLMFHILPLSAAFPLILNCSWCTAQSLTPQVPGY